MALKSMQLSEAALLSKYNVSAPRYTSYPTVPFWQKTPPKAESWFRAVADSFQESREISLYIHLPFCERLCTYCGCNTKITQRHAVEMPYIEAVWTEWAQYLAQFPEKPLLKELHLGGGTPTFFSPENLALLISKILETVDVSDQHDFGFEAHPNSTTAAHLKALKEVGFNRISIGVQDFNQNILKVINRIQTEEDIAFVTQQARELGYESVNYDIIYGLPFQKTTDIIQSMAKVKELKPDRLAFYSYAHVPWIKGSQRAYSEDDLPNPAAKRRLYELGKELLNTMGYQEIGLDHFALPSDSLYQAMVTGELHRNFMGYTPLKSNLLIGLGASAISEAGTAYIQNEKGVKQYQDRVAMNEIPFFRGHLLSKLDLVMKRCITNIMCQKATTFEGIPICLILKIKANLTAMQADGLLKLTNDGLSVTARGLPFLRNIAMAFDLHLLKSKPKEHLFSKAI